jgi:maltose alpha-D-glucosyltransferase/alpha-amylase
VDVEYRDGGVEQYALPLAMAGGTDATPPDTLPSSAVVARISGAQKGVLYDGLFDDALCTMLLRTLRSEAEVPMQAGRLSGSSRPVSDRAEAHPDRPIERTAPDQSNTSVLFGKRFIMKLFRKIEPGPHPEIEVGDVLAARGFTRIPPLTGTLSYVGADAVSVLAMAQEYVFNQGNGWQVSIDELGRYFERAATLPTRSTAREAAPVSLLVDPDQSEPRSRVSETIGTYLTLAGVLGRRTGELHVRLAEETQDSAFAPEPFTRHDVRTTAAAMRRNAGEQLDLVERHLDRLDERRRALAREVLAHRADVLRVFEDVDDVGSAGQRIRCHGDYHLGQVLVTEGDVTIFDFEGEPARPLDERRQKCSPLRDVAGMLRSFSYAALTGLAAATATRPEDMERLAPWAEMWEQWVGGTFLRAYIDATRESSMLPSHREDLEALLQLFLMDKAAYEVSYELNNRPDWVHVPLAGMLRLRSRSGPSVPQTQ